MNGLRLLLLLGMCLLGAGKVGLALAADAVINTNDVLEVSVFGHPEMAATVRVDGQGRAVCGADFFGHGDAREQMAARAAAGNDDPQRSAAAVCADGCGLPGAARAGSAGRQLAPRRGAPAAPMFIRIPIVAMFNTSDVPP